MVEHDEDNTEIDGDDGVLNAIPVAINALIHAVKDTEEAASLYIPVAIKIHNKRALKANQKFEEGSSLLDTEEKQSQALGMKYLLDAGRTFDRLENSRVPDIIEKSLFLNLFSDFDSFIGELVSCIFFKKPELFNSLGRQISVADILSFNDFDELKEKVLSDEIECLRRKSYVDQFTDIGKTFRVELKKFDRWSQFVELTQRRNLLMHCNGIVSEQYMTICKQEGYKFDSEIVVGSKLKIGKEYFISSINLILEVAVKLGHTLWRKVFPDELEEADDHLADVIYDFLHEEDWNKAICFGEYSNNLQNVSSDLRRKINIINLVIAYKMSGDNNKACEVLSSIDWSASLDDFKIAQAVLLDDFDGAKEFMIKIGKKGTLIKESAYHNFPLFKEFRSSEQFKSGYEEVFGYSFLSELKRKAEEKSDEENSEILSEQEIIAPA
ncbi:hypothetical protein [Methylomonas koyamae]|uniref:hypothetical protein n=1 Tax=Methylomonas koyamae TaxID=702114 RepID=UPI0012FD4B90|nr:hypothetical protein [Methylomonas koyamae]